LSSFLAGPLDSLKTMETHYDSKHSVLAELGRVWEETLFCVQGKWEEDKAHYEGLIAAAEEKE